MLVQEPKERQGYEEAGSHPVQAHRSLLRFAPSVYAVATTAVLLALFLVALLPQVDSDFWWHLKVGQYITQHHTVPSRDFMSFTFTGHPWTDHEWLAEMMLYGLYRLAGLWGPIVFFAMVICAAFAVVYATMIQRGVPRVLALFVLVAAATASRGSWGARIQMISLLFLAIYAFTLYRFQLTRDRRLLAVFPLLMLLWANIHGGFVLGLVPMAITLAGETLNRLSGNDDALSWAELRALGIAFVVTLAVTMVNPNGVRQLLYPLAFILPNAYTNSIEESASPNFHLLVMMLFEAQILLLVTAVFIARPRLNWTHLFLILAFTHLALSEVRNVPLWSVIVSPLLALYLYQAALVLRERFPRFSYRRRPVRGRLVPVFNLVLLAMVLVVYIAEAHTFVTQKELNRSVASSFPTGGVAYLRSHALPPRAYVSYTWGGYLLWNLFPRYRDFMDSRADTLFNTRILDDYLSAYAGHPGWKSILDRYRVQDVLIEPNAPLAQVLAQSHGWRRVYHDPVSVLYTRA